jgi:hypothetical protein
MSKLEAIRYVGGFANAGSITPVQYYEAKPDPLVNFVAPVMKHMNDDHKEDIISIVKHYLQIPCRDAEILNLDQFGLTLQIKILSETESHKVRVTFPTPVLDRKGIKNALVDMTNKSKQMTA